MNCVILKHDGEVIIKDNVIEFDDCFDGVFSSLESFTIPFKYNDNDYILFFNDVLTGIDDNFKSKYNDYASKLVNADVYGDVIICSPKKKHFYDLYEKYNYKNVDKKFIECVMRNGK